MTWKIVHRSAWNNWSKIPIGRIVAVRREYFVRWWCNNRPTKSPLWKRKCSTLYHRKCSRRFVLMLWFVRWTWWTFTFVDTGSTHHNICIFDIFVFTVINHFSICLSIDFFLYLAHRRKQAANQANRSSSVSLRLIKHLSDVTEAIQQRDCTRFICHT